MFIIGDIIMPKQRESPIENLGITVGDVFYKGVWHAVCFDQGAMLLVVGVERDDPNGFVIDIVDLDNGWCVKYRGVPDVFVEHCEFF